MSYVLIDHWSAVEIFCRVVCEFDHGGRKIEEFKHNNVLRKELLKYSKGDLHAEVSTAVFNMKENGRKQDVSKRPKSFYELGRKVRYHIPVVLEEDELEGYLEFAKMSSASVKREYCSEWIPSDKQRRFEGTNWQLYYFDSRSKNDKSNSQQIDSLGGVAIAVLRLKPFGKAQICGFEESQNYEGSFQMYGKDEKFISLEMKLTNGGEKDLRMLFYIGLGSVTLALGQYHNVAEAIYSGTVMMEVVSPEKERDLKAGYYGPEKINQLPEYVQKYFKEKQRNMLRVPTKISSLPEFEKWHARKNSK